MKHIWHLNDQTVLLLFNHDVYIGTPNHMINSELCIIGTPVKGILSKGILSKGILWFSEAKGIVWHPWAKGILCFF